MDNTVVFVFLLINLLAQAIAAGSSSCVIKDFKYTGCRYTVICEEYPDGPTNPECDHTTDEKYVTFIMTHSKLDNPLTYGFFASTNFDSRVREIRAIENKWPILGNLAFRYYARTIVLDLSGNGIEQIGKSFQNLAAMQSLNISNNAIKYLDSDSFYITSDSRGGSLEILDISNNKLEQLYRDVFSNIPYLKILYLQKNNLKDLSDAFISAGNLIFLDLSFNKITALNDTLVRLKYLNVLNVSNNQISQLAGHETNQLINLKTVNMSHNYIEIIESNCFNQAFQLLTLDLSFNKLKSKIDNLIFINTNKLEYLNLFQNNITQIQDDAFKHTHLQFINLENNYLSGEITSNQFSGLKNVTSLNLSYQNISFIRKNAFSDAVNLVSLNISRNNIQFIENALTKAISLKVLDVSYNNISNISFLRDSFPGVSDIYLQNNNIIKIPKYAFENQTLLTRLDLSQNKIKNIEPNALPLNNLQYLYLKGNNLEGSLDRGMLSPSSNLRSLELSNFKINRINEFALFNMSVLARLNISHNNLEYIDPNNFVGMDNMYSLDVSYNQLTGFYLNNSRLINLKALYLNNNNLSNISRTLTNMTGLLYVDLSYNNIADLSGVPFTGLQNLKVLHLSHNNIKVFNNPQTNSLVKLTDLFLSGNQLAEINLSYFRDLGMVDISKNKLTYFNSSFFDNLDSLQSIDLSGNNIAQISPGTFQYVKILKFLNLSHNNISNLRYGVFRGLNRTEALDLSFNNLGDFEVDVFHECTELKILTIDNNNLKSLDIERLVATLPKLSKLSIGGNPLSCKEIIRNIKTVNKNLIRQVEVTSVDKIYHDDNVHGIKCGDTNVTAATEIPSSKPLDDSTSATSSGAVIFVWCSVLTIIVIVVIGVGIFLYRREQQQVRFEMESRLNLRSSMSGYSETSDNLLG